MAKSYPTSKVRDSGPECQAATAQEWPGGASLHLKSGVVAERSYPASEVSGSQEETPHARGQGRWLRGVTPHLRRVAAGMRHPHIRGQGPLGEATQGAVAAQAQEGIGELSHVEGQEWRR